MVAIAQEALSQENSCPLTGARLRKRELELSFYKKSEPLVVAAVASNYERMVNNSSIQSNSGDRDKCESKDNIDDGNSNINTIEEHELIERQHLRNHIVSELIDQRQFEKALDYIGSLTSDESKRVFEAIWIDDVLNFQSSSSIKKRRRRQRKNLCDGDNDNDDGKHLRSEAERIASQMVEYHTHNPIPRQTYLKLRSVYTAIVQKSDEYFGVGTATPLLPFRSIRFHCHFLRTSIQELSENAALTNELPVLKLLLSEFGVDDNVESEFECLNVEKVVQCVPPTVHPREYLEFIKSAWCDRALYVETCTGRLDYAILIVKAGLFALKAKVKHNGAIEERRNLTLLLTRLLKDADISYKGCSERSSMLPTIDKKEEERTTVGNNANNDNDALVKGEHEESFVTMTSSFHTAVNQSTTSQSFHDEDDEGVGEVDGEGCFPEWTQLMLSVDKNDSLVSQASSPIKKNVNGKERRTTTMQDEKEEEDTRGDEMGPQYNSNANFLRVKAVSSRTGVKQKTILYPTMTPLVTPPQSSCSNNSCDSSHDVDENDSNCPPCRHLQDKDAYSLKNHHVSLVELDVVQQQYSTTTLSSPIRKQLTAEFEDCSSCHKHHSNTSGTLLQALTATPSQQIQSYNTNHENTNDVNVLKRCVKMLKNDNTTMKKKLSDQEDMIQNLAQMYHELLSSQCRLLRDEEKENINETHQLPSDENTNNSSTNCLTAATNEFDDNSAITIVQASYKTKHDTNGKNFCSTSSPGQQIMLSKDSDVAILTPCSMENGIVVTRQIDSRETTNKSYWVISSPCSHNNEDVDCDTDMETITFLPNNRSSPLFLNDSLILSPLLTNKHIIHPESSEKMAHQHAADYKAPTKHLCNNDNTTSTPRLIKIQKSTHQFLGGVNDWLSE